MKKTLLVLLMLAILVLVACSSGEGTRVDASTTLAPIPPEYAGKTNPLDTSAASAGAEVFKTNCSSCHGESGHGDGPAGASLDPRPRNLVEFQSKVADDYLFWRINTGKDGTSMVAWQGVLTDQQIWQVIAFVRTLK